MKVLLIGGTRFIGPAVVQLLCKQGHDVTMLHRGQTQTDLPAGVQHIFGDRSKLSEYYDTLRQLAPEVVLDMIAFNEQEACAVMETCKGLTQRIVVLSSGDVYRAYDRIRGIESSPPDPVPLSEDAPLRTELYPYRQDTPRSQDDPMRWYDDYDKIPVERIIMSDPALPGTILRLPAVYGPGDNQHRCFEYLKRMDDKRPVIVVDESLAHWRWTHGYVENVAAAIVLAVTDQRAAQRIYNVGEAHTLTITEWIEAIGEAAGWHGHVITMPKKRLPAQLRSDIDSRQDLLMDSTRIREELGYREPISVRVALERTVAWERAHPPVEIDPAQFDYAAEDAVLA